MEFHNIDTGEQTVMPPWYHTSPGYYDSDTESEINDKYRDKTQHKGCFSSLFDFFKHRKHHGDAQQQTRIDWDTITTDLDDLLSLYAAIQKALRELKPDSPFKTLNEFLDDYINDCPDWVCKRKDYVENVLYPFISSGWGVDIKTIEKFGAFYAMLYLGAGSTWYDAPDGLSCYINTMASQLKRSELKLNTKIDKIIPIIVNGVLKYQLQQDGQLVKNDKGKVNIIDYTILDEVQNVKQREES